MYEDAETDPSEKKTTIRLDPKTWRHTEILSESVEEITNSSTGQTALLRKRVVEDSNLPFPVYLEESVDGETTVLINSFAANQIVLYGEVEEGPAESQEIAESLGWKLSIQSVTPFQAILETDSQEIDTVASALQSINLSDSSLEAEPNYIVYASLVPNDPRHLSNEQWGLHQLSDIDINAREGWDRRTSASLTILAILDTGMRFDHEDLEANIWINTDEIPDDKIDNDYNGYTDDLHGIDVVNGGGMPHDDNGHGTHVAGIAGAVGNNSKGIAGVAWNIQLMPIKILNQDGRGTSSGASEGIRYAVRNGALVINASWGSDQASNSLRAAIEFAQSRGVLVVAAAGNDGDEHADYPARFQSPNIIAVGALSRSGTLATFSNYNQDEVDLCAPGEDILSTWHSATNAYMSHSGTSMAAPFVSGAVALNVAQFPNDDYSDQKQRILNSARPRAELNHQVVTSGILNLSDSLILTSVKHPPVFASSALEKRVSYEGDMLVFSPIVFSKTATSFKWQFNDIEIQGATSNSLTLKSTSPSDRGTYTVIASNAVSSVSKDYKLSVYPRMRDFESALGSNMQIFASHEEHWKLENDRINNKIIDSEPQAFLDFRVTETGLITFLAKANYPDTVTSSIRSDDDQKAITSNDWQPFNILVQPTTAAYSARLEITPSQSPQAAPENSIQIQKPFHYTRSTSPPTILRQPSSQTAFLSQQATLSVSVFGENLSYQWFRNDQIIGSAQSSAYKFDIENESSGGFFHVVVSNDHGIAKSGTATVTIDPTPQLARFVDDTMLSLNLKAGETITLSKTVTGTPPIRLQWTKELQPIFGANDMSLVLGPLSPAHSGRYNLTAGNDLDSSNYLSLPISITVTEEGLLPDALSFDDSIVKFTEISRHLSTTGYKTSTDESLSSVLDLSKGTIELYSRDSYLFTYDEETKLKGSSSLRFDAPFFIERDPSIEFSETTTGYGSVFVKSEGFPPGSRVLYTHGGRFRKLELNKDWTQISLSVVGSGLRFELPNDIGNAKIWFDQMELLDPPQLYFRAHPVNVATYIGAKITLPAHASTPSRYLVSHRWLKDGVYLPGSYQAGLTIDSVGPDDIGTYQAVATLSNGLTAKSDSVKLSLLDEDYGAAIGFPGARVTLEGNYFWKVDFTTAIEGPSSLYADGSEELEPSTITIEIDQPTEFGVYYRYMNESRSGEATNWRFTTAHGLPGNSNVLRFTLPHSEGGSRLYYSARIDALRATRLGHRIYETWIQDELPSGLYPNNDKARDRDGDPDGDSIPNWLEFALSLDPNESDVIPQFGIEAVTGNTQAILHFYANRSDDYSIVYEASFDLETWVQIKPKIDILQSTAIFDEIRASVPISANPDRPYFLRWRVLNRYEKGLETF